jgi:hypothetical protein
MWFVRRLNYVRAYSMRSVKIPALSFSTWYRWDERHNIPKRHLPGVYLISLTRKNLQGTSPDFSDVSYIGMTNSKKGLAGRLGQFWQGIRGIRGRHAGGDNVFESLQHYDTWSSRLRIFVAVMPVDCNTVFPTPNDLIKMGWVAFLEYEAFAKYFRQNLSKRRPTYNEQ